MIDRQTDGKPGRKAKMPILDNVKGPSIGWWADEVSPTGEGLRAG